MYDKLEVWWEKTKWLVSLFLQKSLIGTLRTTNQNSSIVASTRPGQISRALETAAEANYYTALAELVNREVLHCEISNVGAGVGGEFQHKYVYVMQYEEAWK